MCKLLIVESDRMVVDQIINIFKTKSSDFDLEMILHTDNYKKAMQICRSDAPDLVLINVDSKVEDCYVSIETMKQIHQHLGVVLLIDEKDTHRLMTTLRRRNERFILKPLDDYNFFKIVCDCILEIESAKHGNKIINQLIEKVQQFKPQIEQNIIYNLITNPQKEILLQDLKILDYTFQDGMIAIMSGDAKKAQLQKFLNLFQADCTHIICSDYHNYIVIMILSVRPLTMFEMDTIRKTTESINSDKFVLGIGYIKNDIVSLHTSYKEALEDLTTHNEMSNSYRYVQPIQYQIHYYVQRVFIYFFMINESYVKLYLKDLADCFSLYDKKTQETLFHSFKTNLAEVVSHTFKVKEDSSNRNIQLHMSNNQKTIYEQLMYLYCEITDPIESMRYRSTYTLLRKILYYVLDNHTDKWLNLENVATKLHISSCYICKLFKNFTNFSFIDYLNDCRIEHAKKLLKNNKKVKDVAYEVGYQSATYFGRVFKQKMGITPKDYQISHNLH